MYSIFCCQRYNYVGVIFPFAL